MDSRTSEEEAIPPVLPPKQNRDSDFGFGSHEESQYSQARMSSDSYQFTNRPLPATPDSHHFHSESSHYEVLEIKSREVAQSIEVKTTKKTAPTPPPKPSRKSSQVMSP